jgi:hypothetical protein
MAGAAICVLVGLGLVYLPAGALRFGQVAEAGCGPVTGTTPAAPIVEGETGRAGFGLALEGVECADDLALLPVDVTGFVTVRPARLVSKLGLKEDGDAAAVFKAWQDGVGIPLAAVERFTLAATDVEGMHRLLIVQTRRSIHRPAVIKACVPAPISRIGILKTGDPKCEIYTSERTGLAVYFPGKNLVVVADCLQTMQDSLTRAASPAPGFKAARERAAKSDLVAWGVTKTPPAGQVTALKPINWLVRKQPAARFLPFFPVPLPATLTAGQMSLDLGKQMDLEMRFTFRDEAAARNGVKCVCRLVDMCRAECLTMLDDEVDDQEEEAPPVQARQMAELAAALEKRLQKVQPHADKETVTVAARVPFEAKQVWSAFVCLAKEECNELPAPKPEVTPGLFFRPPGAENRPDLVPPPPGMAPAPQMPPPVETARGWGSTGRAPGVAPAPQMPPPGIPMLRPPAPPAPVVTEALPVAPAKLTVANVRKEEVLLFTVDRQSGDLNFVKKLPAGEAADVKTVTGERWVAVFLSAPYRVKYVVVQPEGVWLLR